MNPEQEYLLKAMLGGAARSFADAVETLQPGLLPRAVAYRHSDADLRATQRLRQIAAKSGVSPEAAEQRYWDYVEAGWPVHVAFDEGLAELDQA